jgi:hypothetical protein
MQAEATLDETYFRPTLTLPLGHLIRISLYWLGLTAIDGAVGLFIQNRVTSGRSPRPTRKSGGSCSCCRSRSR